MMNYNKIGIKNYLKLIKIIKNYHKLLKIIKNYHKLLKIKSSE